MSLIQLTNNNATKTITNYIYDNPNIAIGLTIFTGSAILLNPVTTVFTGVALTKPYLDPYIEYYTNEYPSLTTTVKIASAGTLLYFGGANILVQNLQNIFTSKIGLSMLGAISTIFLTSSYYLGLKETSSVYKQCLDQTMAIEIVTDLTFLEPANIYVPALGFFSSCTLRATSREYFLGNKTTNSHLKILSVSLISGAMGGGLKYGLIASVIENKNWQIVLKKSIIGALNHGTYASLTAYAQNKTIPFKMDDFSSFLAEPLDVITGYSVGTNDFTSSNLKKALEAALMMYSSAQIFLPATEKTTSQIINMLRKQAEYEINNDIKICLAGDNANIDGHNPLCDIN